MDLYRPEFEHDACGVAFVVDMHGRRSHDIVRMGLASLCNLEHRGASGAEVNTGDGAGILIQIPDRFYREVTGLALPDAGGYATGIAFLPTETPAAARARDEIESLAHEEGLVVLGWRDVPVDPSPVGSIALSAMPSFHQIFVASAAGHTGLDLERRAFILRKRVERQNHAIYFPSLSARTIVYKGMLTAPQVESFFLDLSDRRLESALALVHSRFSTNTFPSWPLAHPYRYLAHNGEINTLQGNRNWMRAREDLLASDLLPGDLERIFPIITPGASDSASFDEVLELLHLGGRPLPHAVLMMIPEAWEQHRHMDAAKRAFYQFHAALMEPWDGPASIAFTDGTVIGAVLDRNGLRPSRYWVTDDGLVVMASEVGVLDIDPGRVVQRGRLQPGRMFLVDTAQGRIVADDEIKADPGRRAPLRGVARPRADPLRRPAPSLHPDPAARVGRRPSAPVRVHHRGSQDPPGAHGGDGLRAHRVHGDRHAARRPVRPAPAAVRLLPAAVRPGDQPAARRHPRGAGHLAGRHHRPGAQPAGPGGGQLQPDRHAPSRSSPTRSWPSCSTSTRTAPSPAGAPSPSTGSSRCGQPSRAGLWPRPSPTSAGRSTTPSTKAPRSSCCPTGTPRRIWRRSPPSCSSARSIIISSRKRPAPVWVSSSKRARPGRCTTWRFSSATERRPSTRTWPSTPSPS